MIRKDILDYVKIKMETHSQLKLCYEICDLMALPEVSKLMLLTQFFDLSQDDWAELASFCVRQASEKGASE